MKNTEEFSVTIHWPLKPMATSLLQVMIPALQRAPTFTCSVASLCQCAVHYVPGLNNLRWSTPEHSRLAWDYPSMQYAWCDQWALTIPPQLSRHMSVAVKPPRRCIWEMHAICKSKATNKSKNCLHFSICACHPCAGAMLIFSVSHRSIWLITLIDNRLPWGTARAVETRN